MRLLKTTVVFLIVLNFASLNLTTGTYASKYGCGAYGSGQYNNADCEDNQELSDSDEGNLSRTGASQYFMLIISIISLGVGSTLIVLGTRSKRNY